LRQWQWVLARVHRFPQKFHDHVRAPVATARRQTVPREFFLPRDHHERIDLDQEIERASIADLGN
jgi:hypothetical protein